MNPGDIALLDLTQPDGTVKRRPVLLIKKAPRYSGWVIAAVSSQLHQEVPGFDVVLNDYEKWFAQTGLRQSSLIRLGMLSTVAASRFPGVLGQVPASVLTQVRRHLSNFFGK